MDLSLYLDLRSRPGTLPSAADYEESIQLVRTADRLGFRAVWTTEQHGVNDGYLPAQFPILAAFARETERLRLGTGVILLPLTHPRHVLEEACTVDIISNGRLILGLGAGNYPNEFRIFGVPMSDRARLMEEGVAFIKDGLSGGRLSDGSWVNVWPVQRPIPLVLGGLAQPAIDRAARLADGHFAYSFSKPDTHLPEVYEGAIAPALEFHGRSSMDFHLLFASVLWASDDAEDEWEEWVGPAFAYQQRKYMEWEKGVPTAGGYAFTQDPQDARSELFVGRSHEITERLLRMHDRYPFDEAVFWARLPGVPLGMALEHLERLAAEVMPHLARAP